MQFYVTVENNDSPHQIRSLASALSTLALELDGVKFKPECATGYSGNNPSVVVTDGAGEDTGPAATPANEDQPKPKRTRKSAAAPTEPEPTPEPEADPDLPADDEPEAPDADEPEEPKAKAASKANGKSAPTDKALRQEVLERFASYADEAGVLEGKQLLGEFNANKFSEVPDDQLRAFAKRLTVLEAAL